MFLLETYGKQEPPSTTKSLLDRSKCTIILTLWNYYKEKLQQITDVKEALQREEVAHSKSVDEYLRLDSKLTALRPLKRQLEEYKLEPSTLKFDSLIAKANFLN